MNEEQFIHRVSKAIKQEFGGFVKVETDIFNNRIMVSFNDSDEGFDMSVEKV